MMLSKQDKAARYAELDQQLEALLQHDLPAYTHLCNALAVLREEFGFFWCGLYLRRDPDALHLGPYQGGLPCLTIPLGQGVCGVAAQQQQTQIVNDVRQFPGYIACHPEPQAEIVVPGVQEGYTYFVLDIDALEKDAFTPEDRQGLETVADRLMPQVRALQAAFPDGGDRNIR